MAGKLIPMCELRATARRAGMWLGEQTDVPRGDVEWLVAISVHIDSLAYVPDCPFCREVDLRLFGTGPTKRAAQIQARENAKIFLEAALAMRYGEGE